MRTDFRKVVSFAGVRWLVLSLIVLSACVRNPTQFSGIPNEKTETEEPGGGANPPSEIPPDTLPNVDYWAERTLKKIYAEPKKEVDLLIVAENSSSMDPYLDNVAKNAGLFVSSLLQRGIDFQLGMVDADQIYESELPILRGPHRIIKNGVGSPVSQIQENIEVIKKSRQYGWEFPLTALHMAAISRNNRDLFRPDTAKMFIILSDAEEPVLVEADQGRVFDEITQVHGSQWRIMSISSPSGQPCPLDGFVVEPAKIVEFYTLASGGRMGRICDEDYTDVLLSAVDQVDQLLTEISLDLESNEELVVSELQVWVAGREVQNNAKDGYQYNPSTKSISFPGSYRPKAGEEIEVRYVVHVH